MKIKDVIVEQEKPGLLRRAAGALGRGAYALTTGEFYPDPDSTPIEQIAKSATKNRSAVINDAILQMQKRKIDTPEKFTQFYQAYFGGENPKLQASIQEKLQDLGRIDPNDTATVQQAITALTDERIKTLSKLAKGEFEPTQKPADAPTQKSTQKSSQTTAKFQPRTPNVWRGRPKVIGRVVVPIRWGKRAGEIVSKTSDGWFDQQGQQITNPNAIKDLDGLLLPQLQQPNLPTRTSRIVK